MKLTKKLEAEITQLMEDYWNSYFRGDIDYWSNYLVPDYRNIGGTEEEIWNSKQEILDYTHRMIDQMKGVSEIRNKQVQIIPYDPYIMVHELLDIYIKIEDEWKFYQKFRLSSLIQKLADGWKVLHQHGSYPDSKTQKGEAFAFDTLHNENLKLQQAIKDRTLELVEKNRELEIEAATERVRVQSMAMQHPDDLDKVNKEILNQLNQLQIPGLTGVTFYLINENGWVNAWDFSSPGNIGAPNSYTLQFDSNKYEMMGEPFRVFGQSDQDYYVADYTFEKLEQAAIELEEINPTVATVFKEALANGKLTHQWSACARISNGLLGIDLVNPPSEDTKTIQLKMAGAFNQAYQRFLDLQKAEAQAREAQIEAALEKVRSRSLAMHKSDELNEVVTVLFEKMIELQVPSTAVGIQTFTEGSKDSQVFVCGDVGTGLIVNQYRLPYFDHPIIRDYFNVHKEKPDYFVGNYPKKEIDSFYDVVLKLPELKDLPTEVKTMIRQSDFYEVTMVPGEKSLLAVNDFVGNPLSESHVNILKRFAKVFDQTYTRFLDLQKAEAQAREANIETTLERVRSRSLAMHNSNELKDVIILVLKNLGELGIDMKNRAAGIFTFEQESKDYYQWAASAEYTSVISFLTPYIDHPVQNDIWNARKTGTEFYAKSYTVEEKNTLFQYFFDLPALKSMPEEDKKRALGFKYYDVAIAFGKNSGLTLVSHSGVLLTADENGILKRLAKVFEQAYIRFLDLQKAEAQAREAEIELGLERVRARAMAMQKSDELSDLVDTVFKELTKLDFALNWCIINIIDEPSLTNMVWAANPETNKPPESYLMKFEDYPFHHSMLKAYRERKTKHVYVIEGEEKKTYDHYLFNETEWRRVPKAAQDASRAMKRYVATFTFSNFGGLQTVGEEYLSEQNLDILSRFGKVFDLTYTRFNDLLKAEAQAREAQIEAALERVRSRSMGMQKSEELKEVIKIVYRQLSLLNIHLDHAGFVVDYKPKGDWHFWIADEQDIPSKITHPYFESVWANQFNEAKEKGTHFFATHLNFEEKNKFYKELLSYVPGLPEASKDFYLNCPGLAASTVLAEDVGLYIENFSGIPYTNDENNTLMRFAKVFQQTYTRFLDLQKAEAQAREAKIEAALEKARARTMGMQSSDELPEVANVLFLEVQGLGIPAWSCGYNILAEDKTSATCCMSSEGTLQTPFKLRLYGEASFAEMGDFLRSEQTMLVQELGGKALEEHYAFMKSFPDLKPTFDQIDELGLSLPTYQINHLCKFTQGFLLFITYEKVPDSYDIFKRFTKVFEQTYTRFLDLKKAEAQAREAQINLAVERVRARALAMFQSEEILHVVNKLKEEIMSLDIPNVIAATIHLKENDGRCRIWDITSIEINDEALHHPMDIRFRLEDTDPNFFMRRIWGNTANYFVEMQDENDLQCTIQWLRDIDRNQQADETEQFIASTNLKQLYHPTIQLNNGRMGIDLTEKPAPEIESILEKMGAAFDLAYTRFLDLQKAESQARQAKIETALEKVRARALAMQEPEELTEVAEVLRHEMGLLGVEELETCSIFIHDETMNRTECWYALKDSRSEEKKLVSDHFPLQLNDTWVGREMQKFYSSDAKQISVLMQGANRKEWINYCEEQSISLQGYYGESIPDRTYHLYKFSHGAIGAASAGDISSESWDLLQRAASVFSLAYSRFKDLTQARFDLQRLKEEKLKAETALSELQTTQKQLIQSEKMASLGELTAGIAHEIQNPLNFVNNFSEVSKEMLDEMREAIEKGDTEEAKEIMNDVIQNLEKINHHGKRADGIVKGMLQHSSSGSGKKEPTDINALAEEYLRLAYHGLRAKDKSFNAAMKTNFDTSIGSINIIPQDIGRVVLNLITNAFYVVNEKSKQNIDGYEPTVVVSTKKENDKVLIEVKDNGNGIPEKVLNKIFQPFFTTKPTGQGTGLGLSLSYDIVKAHGGEIKIQTKESSGAEFIIQLPINNK